MPQPPTNPLLSRELVRELPFAAQHSFRNAALGALGTMVAAFDLGLKVTDINQFLTPATLPSADPHQHAIGPFLDALVFTDGPGSILVEYAVDYTCSYRTIATTIIPVSVATNISGLRVTGRFVRVTFTNTDAGAAHLAEFGVYIRSR